MILTARHKTQMDLSTFRAPLLRWFRKHHRKLPWRVLQPGTPDAYHVLVSEAMLQQTQVATVIDYFNRFTEVLPTVHALANADEQQVLRLWQGLGYYRRARNLHAAAKKIVNDFGGNIPDTVEQLLELPGVGRYTAGAIASIAFSRRAPLLDGNVARVLARWFDIRDSIDEPATNARLWELAEQLVPAKHPGDFNQALMELGAMVCTPRNPQCLTCPLASLCEANHAGSADTVPVRSVRKSPKNIEHHILAVGHGEHWLFTQRPGRGLWSNMWQMPTCEQPLQSPASLADWLRTQTNMRISKPAELATFTHQTTHRTIRFTLWHATAKTRSKQGCWRTIDDLDDLPLPNPQRKAVALLHKLQQPSTMVGE